MAACGRKWPVDTVALAFSEWLLSEKTDIKGGARCRLTWRCTSRLTIASLRCRSGQQSSNARKGEFKV